MNNKLLICILFGVLLTSTLSNEMMVSNKTGQTRYALLKSYPITGVRNVRWETMPINYVDSNGIKF